MEIAQALLYWFDQHKRRHLPWRQDPTPYHVWVSEIMLQQTRVETVIDYYNRFMAKLPDISALASVAEDELLKLWEGLGYYSRARNLQKAALEIVHCHGGEIPRDRADLLALPGIGPYTAGAIRSIAFQEADIAADGNAYRIAARLTMEEGLVDKPQTRKNLEAYLKNQLSVERPGDFNQALMDLGSGICLANGTPLCDACPLFAACQAGRAGLGSAYPKREKKKKKGLEQLTVLVLRRGTDLFLAKRPKGGLLAGLWALPMWSGHLSQKEVEERLARMLPSTPYRLKSVRALGPARHLFTHKEWQMVGYEILLCESTDSQYSTGKEARRSSDISFLKEKGFVEERLSDFYAALGFPSDPASHFTWAPPEQVQENLAIPTAYQAFLREA